MKPIYIDLVAASGSKDILKINFMEVDDIIAAHGNKTEFAGNVTYYEYELQYTRIDKDTLITNSYCACYVSKR